MLVLSLQPPGPAACQPDADAPTPATCDALGLSIYMCAVKPVWAATCKCVAASPLPHKRGCSSRAESGWLRPL
eukprot:scaffold7849_cov457-Prasinococcus_capsulatus_cf.AAC.8